MGQDRSRTRIIIAMVVCVFAVAACGARSGEGLLEASDTTTTTSESSTTATSTDTEESASSTGPSPAGPSTLKESTSTTTGSTASTGTGSTGTTKATSSTTKRPTTQPPTTLPPSTTTTAKPATTAATGSTAPTTLGIQRIEITPELGAKAIITGNQRIASRVEYDTIHFKALDTGNVVVTNAGGSDLCFDEGSGDVTVTGTRDEIGRSCTITVSVAGNAAFAPASYQVTVELVADFHLSYSVTGAPFTGCYTPGSAILPIVITGDRVDELDVNLGGRYVLDGFAEPSPGRQTIKAKIAPDTPIGTKVTANLSFGYPGVLLFTADPATPYAWEIKGACP